MNGPPSENGKPERVVAKWGGGQRFDSGRPNGPVATLDGTGGSGQSPVDALLSALAACAGIDVVEILAKRRTPVESFEIEMTGERVDTVPRRYKAIMMTFRMRGAGIEREQAERAVDLSLNKYCSVRASLASDIQIEWKLELEA